MIFHRFKFTRFVPKFSLRHSPWLWLIIWIGTALRLFRLGDQSLWFDEAARLAMSRSSLISILLNEGQDTLPPFFHLCQHFWLAIVGVNDFLVRFLPAMGGVLFLAVVYRLGSDLWGKKAGLLTLTLAAIMPYLVYQSQQANLYSFLAVLSGFQIFAFWRAIHTNRKTYWLFFATSTTLGLYTHYFVLFLIISLHVFWFLYRNNFFNRWRQILLADSLVSLAFLPQLNRMLQGTDVVFSNFWLNKPNFFAPISTLYLFTMSYSLPRWIIPVAMFLVLAIWAIGLYETVLKIKNKRNDPKSLAFSTVLMGCPILLVFVISQIKPIFLERTLIVVVPAYITLLSYLCLSSPRQSPLRYLYWLLGGLMLFSLSQYYFNPAFAKPLLRDVAQHIDAHYQPGDVVIDASNSSYVPLLFYKMPQEHFLLSGDPAPYHPATIFELAGGEEITFEAIKKYDRIWLIVMLDHSIEYQQQVISTFDNAYELQENETIGGIIVRRYDQVVTQ